MKKFIFLVLIFIFAHNLQAQEFRPNGWCFTPKGTLRVMMLFVGFGPDFDTTHWVNGWDGKKDFPDAYYNDKLFYSDTSLFDTPIIPKRDSNNISRWYYEMSKHSSVPFKLVVDAYKVNLNPDSIRTVKSWDDLDKGTLKQFVIDNPNFDWTIGL